MTTQFEDVGVDGDRPVSVCGTVSVAEGVVMLHGFEERDAQVVAYIEQAGDRRAAVHDCLVLGARAMAAAVTSADAAVVEKAFAEMTGTFASGLEGFAFDIAATAK